MTVSVQAVSRDGLGRIPVSRLSDDQVQILQPLVSQVAIELKRKYSMLDRADLEQ